jgi:hypothetical protein
MRWLGLVVVVAACGHGEGGADIWDVRMDQFANALCRNSCTAPDQQDSCIVGVLSDMDQAKSELTPAGQDMCINCIVAKTSAMPMIVANGCATNPSIDASIVRFCDNDPTQDFDFDGDPTNDQSEACAGFPFSGGVDNGGGGGGSGLPPSSP